MQSPRNKTYDDQGKDKERVYDSLTTAKDENDNDNLFDLSTSQKNKRRVHYPQANGEYRSSSVDLHTKTANDSCEKLASNGDHVIPIKDETNSSSSLGRRFDRFVQPWREFIAYQSSWSWVILVAAFLTYSIGEALTSVFPILFVALQKEYPDEGSSGIALVQSMMNAVPCLSGPIASIITTRLGYRKTTMLGGMITSLSLLATSFASNLKVLYLTMGFCYAFGNSLVLVATVVAVTEHFDAKPSFASGVTISGGAFGQCVFAFVLQKLIDKYEWNGTMMLFSGIVLSIVAFGALFREVEWDEEDYEEEEGEEEEIENGNETSSTAIPASEQSEILPEPISNQSVKADTDDTEKPLATDDMPPSTHKPSFTDSVFYNPFEKQELLDQYSKSEICLPSAIREQYEQEYRQRLLEEEQNRTFNDQVLSSSTTQLEQSHDHDQTIAASPLVERSNSCKSVLLGSTQNLPISDSIALPLTKSTRPNPVNRKGRSNHRRPRGMSTNKNEEPKPLIYHFPLHHQHHNIPINIGRTHHHHHHHHHPLHFNRGNLSHLALCSKNIYNYESVLNICKLQSLHFSIDRSLSLPNLYSPMIAGRKRHRSVTITGNLDAYLHDEEDEEDETTKKTTFEQLYRDICKLVRVLRILPFLLLCICVTIITIFYDATWTFIVDYMQKEEIPETKGSHLLLGVGIVAIFGEIGYGYMGDSKRIPPLYVYACSLSLAGLSQLIIPFVITKYSRLMLLMLFIGFLQCAQEVLMPILCIKFAGTQNFTNAYGMLLLCQGISSLIGPPSLGLVADRNSYGLTYRVIGIGTAFGALSLFSMPVVQKFYSFITSKTAHRKTNTLVTASNGDLLSPSSVKPSSRETLNNLPGPSK